MADRRIKIERDEDDDESCENSETDIPCISTVPFSADKNTGSYYYPSQAVVVPRTPVYTTVGKMAQKRKTVQALAQVSCRMNHCDHLFSWLAQHAPWMPVQTRHWTALLVCLFNIVGLILHNVGWYCTMLDDSFEQFRFKFIHTSPWSHVWWCWITFWLDLSRSSFKSVGQKQDYKQF